MDYVIKVRTLSLALGAACAIVFAAGAAQAEPDFKTVGGLRNNCHLVMERWEEISTQEQIQATACSSYVQGVVEMMNTNCISDLPVPESLRTSSPHTARAYIQGFLNWADDNPARWSENKFMGLVEALSTTFPCNE